MKNIVSHTYKPLLVRYLSRARIFRKDGITLDIPPAVFHPGFFTSTRFLFQYLRKLPLNNKKFLELGAGSGFISFYAAKKGAKVTASDISKVAVEWLEKNSRQNNLPIEIVHSDLFNSLPVQRFDIIAINPPYYKKNPVTEKEFAWYCGENGEYFINLFASLEKYAEENAEILVVLCDGCDLDMISKTASLNNFQLQKVAEKRTLVESSYIFKIIKSK